MATKPVKMLNLVCIWCNKPFQAEKPRKTCSAKCRLANFRAKRSRLPYETAVCEHCGKTFKRRTRENPRRYCSPDCANFAEAGIAYRPRAKTYAEISKHNREHPLAPGWRK
jgi:predicted amidophosphoribosyltransferase